MAFEDADLQAVLEVLDVTADAGRGEHELRRGFVDAAGGGDCCEDADVIPVETRAWALVAVLRFLQWRVPTFAQARGPDWRQLTPTRRRRGGGRVLIIGRHTVASAPSGILCLNLRREHVARLAGAAAALARAERELAFFRTAGLPVFHAYVRQPRERGAAHGAIAGLEPRLDEPVFALPQTAGLSRLDIETIRARVRRLHVVGDADAPFAAALRTAGVDWAVVAEACFTRTSEFDGRAERGQCNRAAQDGANVIWVKSWRS